MRRSLLFIVFLAFAWRVLGLERQSLWRDEVDAIYFSLRALPDLRAMFTDPGQNGALYFLALRPWFALVGTGEFALRFPSAIAGVLSVPLMWQVGRHLMPVPEGPAGGGRLNESGTGSRPRGTFSSILRNPPFLAALLLAANPYQLWYAQEGKMYALVTFLALLAAWFWLRAVGRGGWRPWLGLLVTVTVAIYTHLLMILLIPLLVVWFLLAWPQSRQHWIGFAFVLGGLTVPYLPLLAWQWPLLMASETGTALPFTQLDSLLGSVLIYQHHSIVPPTHLIWLAPFFIIGLYGLLLGSRQLGSQEPDFGRRSIQSTAHRRPLPLWRRHLLIIAWLFIPVLSIYLLSLRQPVFLPRYVIWIAPAVMMLIALGVRVLWRNSSGRTRPLVALLLIYLIGYWVYVGRQEKTVDLKTDLRGAVGYIAQGRPPDELLILQMPYLERAYRYYSGDQGRNPFAGSDQRLGRWRGGPWTNNGLSDAEARQQVDAEMRDKTAGASTIWVLRSEAHLADERDLMGEWLHQNATLLEEVAFFQATVRVYRK